MKVLFHHWPSFFQNDILDIFQESNTSYDLLTWNFLTNNDKDAFLYYIRKNHNLHQYDLLFSINYWPLLSQLCQENHLPYVAWCYDAPLPIENIEETLGNTMNHIFCFDKVQVSNYQRQGFQTVFHLPLGVNAKRLSQIVPSAPQCAHYMAEVSFVGKLYPSAADWILTHCDEYSKGYLHALLDIQKDIYGANIIDPALTELFVKHVNDSFIWPENSDKKAITAKHLSFALACETTRRERIILLSLCGKRYHTRLYSHDNSYQINSVQLCPPVNYWKEMPYVFAATKINLNMTLRSIQSGIPLRALDIMGCGGFLLSNYQEELGELFQDGDDMVMYESIPDAIEKINFYLEHETLREKIARNGRIKTLSEHDMKNKLTTLFSCYF